MDVTRLAYSGSIISRDASTSGQLSLIGGMLLEIQSNVSLSRGEMIIELGMVVGEKGTWGLTVGRMFGACIMSGSDHAAVLPSSSAHHQ